MRHSTPEDNEAVIAMFHPVADGQGWIGAFGEITQFGGANDPEDSGSTACGHSTIEHPDAMYCALPIPVRNHFHVRCGMPVYFQHGTDGPKVIAYLWDVGPSCWTRRVADVGPAVMRALGGDGRLDGVRVTFKP